MSEQIIPYTKKEHTEQENTPTRQTYIYKKYYKSIFTYAK